MNLPLSTAFTESHMFWVTIFSFSFVSMHILISFLISSMTCLLYRNVLLSLHMFVFLRDFSCSVQFSNSVMSYTLWPHEPQHARPPCPSPTSRVHPNPCPLCQWCHPTISSSVVPFSYCPQSFPASGFFPNESAFCITWPQYWRFSFNISSSNEHPGLSSFRMDWWDILAVQGTLKSSPTPQFESINSSVLSFPYSPTLTSIHDYWKNHSLD